MYSSSTNGPLPTITWERSPFSSTASFGTIDIPHQHSLERNEASGLPNVITTLVSLVALTEAIPDAYDADGEATVSSCTRRMLYTTSSATTARPLWNTAL